MSWKDKFPQENIYFQTDNGILYCGDCLEIMSKFPEESIDLIYIDPPFGIDRDKVFGLPKWKSTEEHYKFCDNLGLNIIRKIDKKGKKSNYGIAHYLYWIYERLKIMKELLSSKGSIYVHLDWHSSHYVKVIMDEIFGKKNFVNEIVWSYEGPQSPSPIKFASKHDVIFRYAKVFNNCYSGELYKEVREPIEKVRHRYQQDRNGMWFYTVPKGDYTDSSIEKLKKENRILVTKSGKIRIKMFLNTSKDGKFLLKKKKISDVWSDIPSLGLVAGSREKVDYGTQKPMRLVERIIKASCPENGIVADFFSGSGTTLIVAEKLGRKWIGCDFNIKACEITKERIMKLQKDLL